MPIPSNIIVTADDFGLNESVNRAILFCFEQAYINSTSTLTNTACFEESVNLFHKNSVMHNRGVHINLVGRKPFMSMDNYYFTDENGNWDANKIKKVSLYR